MARLDLDWDWRLLRGALLALTGSLVLGGTLAVSGYFFLERMNRSFEAEHRRFLSASQRYLLVDKEEQLIQTYRPRFDALVRNGMLGDEPRLAWTEALQTASTALGLPSLRYDVQPSQPYESPLPLESGLFRVYGTRMRLNAGLLHEDDLFRLLAFLSQHAQGQYTVERCSLRPARQGEGQAGQAVANLEGECELIWFTLKQPKADEPPA
jgi:hypothetical protein